MKIITIFSNFYTEIIFDFCIILVASIEHMFFSIYCSSSLENDLCKKDRKLRPKINKLINKINLEVSITIINTAPVDFSFFFHLPIY